MAAFGVNGIQLVFANYHCADAIAQAIVSALGPVPAAGIDVVVVDNAGPGFNPAVLPDAAASRVRVLRPGANAGYFGAIRLAYETLKDESLRFRILCNPDLEFVQPECLQLLGALTLPPRCAVVAPRIISGLTGADQNPYLVKPPSDALVRRWRWVYRNLMLYQANDWASWVKSHLRRTRVSGQAGGAVDSVPAGQLIHAPHGAMIIFSEAFLQETAALSKVPFLYAEELFIGEICRREQWAVWYEPSLVVRHREHATTGLLASSKRFELQRAAVLAYLDLLATG
jgi:GT2 family glycosyltransferase